MVFSSIPQVVTEDRASGAQFTEGSLRFDSGKSQHLKRTYNSAGNRRFWTWSAWVKRGSIPSSNVAQSLFGAYYNSSNRDVIRIGGEVQDSLSYQNGNSGDYDSSTTSAVLRDTGWYHFVVSVDLNQGTQTDRVKIYVNGELQSKSNDAQATRDSFINWEGAHFIGARSTDGTGSAFWDGGMSQVYFIDGQALGPEEFGYTDPLTNTWRSKKFEHLSTSIATQYSGASALTWDDNPIGSVYTLSNGNRTATAGGGGNGYSGADVWSNAIPANSTTAWTLEITNSDTVGGWYFTDSQTASGTHPDERGGNSLGMRNQDADAGWFGTFATANGGSNQGHVLPLLSCHTWGSKRVDFVVYRPASGNGKVWVKNNGSSTWVGGGNPSDTSSTPSFVIPDGNTYFGYTFYDRGNGDQVATFDGDGSIQQKIGANSFYLPMDGNSPIGEDKSGKGNNWTPINFGGSNSLEKATGALPILNTTQGGTQASVGVFGSKEGFFETVSSSSGSGNPYIFDGRGTQPTLSLIRGATYVFDYSSATSHPLRFATAADAAGSTEYTTGTSISGNVISFTVPHDAPAALYYYCANHSGMGNSISVTTDETKADKYASNCVLALPLVGVKNDVSNSVNCTSTTKTTAVTNAVASNKTSNFYSGSYYFDGSGDYINVTAQSELSLQGDFTIECWTLIDTNVSNGKQISSLGYHVGGKDGNWYFGLSSSGGYEIVLYTYDGTSNGEYVNADLGAPQIDKWYHIAAVRIGTTVTLYVDGVSKASGTISKGLDNGGVDGLTLGRISQNGGSGAYGTLNGYIQDLRIYNGVGKYTGNFVPAATSPDILPDTPSGVAGSSKLTKITDGAVSFDGSDDYLTSTSSDYAFGTGDFTVEAYVYCTVLANYRAIATTRYDNGPFSDAWHIGLLANGTIAFYSNEYDLTGPAGSAPQNRWFHLAVTRSSSAAKMFVDGKLVTSGTVTKDYTRTLLGVGDFPGTQAEPMLGYISNLRIIKGTALYTSNFTPPTRALTNVTNTKLLCCQSNISANLAAVSPATFSNDGTVWSSSSTISSGGAAANKPLTNGFDGSISSAFEGASSGATVTVPVSATISAGGVRVYAAVASSTPLVVAIKNGGTTVETINGANSGGQWYASSSYSGTITSLAISRTSRAPEFNAVEINGCVLIDGISGEAIQRVGDVAATNFNPFTTDINTVRGQETGYATLNPLSKSNNFVMSNGNLSIENSSSTGACLGTIPYPKTGKWYYEIVFGSVPGYNHVGIAREDTALAGNPGYDTSKQWTYWQNGKKTNNVSYANAYAAGDAIGCAFDADAGSLVFYKNGTSQGVNATGLTSSEYKYYPYFPCYTFTADVNFGQKPFKFPPPDGFQPLNHTTIRPETVIARPDQYVGTSLYTGNGGTSQTVTGLEFKPDFVWIKGRSNSAWHRLQDSVRGANKLLYSNSTNAEATNEVNGYVSSFTTDGFVLADPDGNGGGVNQSGGTYVAWAWKAGGNKGTFNVDDVGYANASDVGMNVGGKNISVYNQDRVWSSGVTLSNGGFDDPITNAFNGNTANRARSAADAPLMTITFNPAVTIGSSLFIQTESTYNAASYAYTATIDGTTYSQSDNYDTTFSQTGSLTQITIDNNDAFGRTYLELIKIDGKELVDFGVTPAINVPSLAATGCSVGTKQGFSIVKWTDSGTNTIPHGLNSPLNFIIVKRYDGSSDWNVYHTSLGGPDKRLHLNSASTTLTGGTWNNTAPTSSVFSWGGGTGDNMVAYCWHDVPGLQKFGKWTNNNSNAGTFTELGFRPAVLLLKDIDGGEQWYIIDSKRQTFNIPAPSNNGAAAVRTLQANSSNDEATADNSHANATVDFLSNGFRIYSTNTGAGEISFGTRNYIYAAWAEAPSMNLYGAQSNAR